MAASAGMADTLYTGGTILTMADSGQVEAVAVAGDTIVCAGSLEEAERFCTAATTRVNLAGRTMLPGFIDAHSHFLDTAMRSDWVDLRSSPLGPVHCLEDIVSLLAARAAVTPKGEWIVGWGYDDTMLKEKRHPVRQDLDRASWEHPIVIQHLTGWVTASNSLALARAGMDKPVRIPENTVLHMDAQGEPDGVIEAALCPVFSLVPPADEEGIQAGIARTSQTYLARGCTTAQEGWIPDPAWISSARRALADGTLQLRLILYPLAQGLSLEEYCARFPICPSGTALDAQRRLVLGASKLSADGSIQAWTGFLTQPYHICPEGRPGWCGYPSNDRSWLIERVCALHRLGLQVAIHCNGDAAIDMTLDAIEEAQRRFPRSDARHIAIHSQMAREDQVERMARLGVIPSFFVAHVWYWGDRHATIFMGPERARRMSPAGDALRRHIPFTLHNDTYVTPIDPLLLVWAAVNRITPEGRDLGRAEQGVPVLEALKAVTIHAARQGFEEDCKGSIEAGKLADFVVLAENPCTVEPMHIRDIAVQATIVGGRLAWGSLSGAGEKHF